MLASDREMLSEACRRLKLLGFSDEYIDRFAEAGEVMVCMPPLWKVIPADEELKQLVQQYEQEYDVRVYLAYRFYDLRGGVQSALLYVDRNAERYDAARFFLADRSPRVLVYEHTADRDEGVKGIRLPPISF